MPAGSRANAAKIEANRESSKSSGGGKGAPSKYEYTKEDGTRWIGSTISNKPGTPSHRAWTFLNTGVDPGPNPDDNDK